MRRYLLMLLVCFYLGYGCKSSFKLNQYAFYDLSYGEVGILISQSDWINLSKEDSISKVFMQQQINESILDTSFKSNILNAIDHKINFDFLGYLTDSLHITLDPLIKQNKYRYYLIYEPDIMFYSNKDSIVKWFADRSNLQLFTRKALILASVENKSKHQLFSDSVVINRKIMLQ